MLDKNTLVKVKNRSLGKTIYRVPDLNVRREFSPGAIKEITVEELRLLSYQDGGTAILRNELIINNDELIQEILGDVEPEYFYTEKEVKDILLYGSVDALLDCLDFSGIGVKNLIKTLAVDLELNDYSKRQAIKDSLGFDVTRAIELKHQAQEDTPEQVVEQKTRRTTTAKESTEAPSRRRVSATTSNK